MSAEGKPDLARVRLAARFVHESTCPPRTNFPCSACPTGRGLLDALRVLDAAPRDARQARRALHDAVCVIGCGPESDHADRTQAKPAAALRKFHALECS